MIRYVPRDTITKAMDLVCTSVTRVPEELVNMTTAYLDHTVEATAAQSRDALLEKISGEHDFSAIPDYVKVEVTTANIRSHDFSTSVVRIDARSKWDPFQCLGVRFIGGPAHGHYMAAADHLPKMVAVETPGAWGMDTDLSIVPLDPAIITYSLAAWDTQDGNWVFTVGGTMDELPEADPAQLCGYPGCNSLVFMRKDGLWVHDRATVTPAAGHHAMAPVQ